MKTVPSGSGAVYGVWADHSTLRRETLGPLFGRISLELRGDIDPVWGASYLKVRKDAEQFSRFTLDAANNHVSFTFRATETPLEVQSLLNRLGLFLEMVNLHATAAAADVRRQTGA